VRLRKYLTTVQIQWSALRMYAANLAAYLLVLPVVLAVIWVAWRTIYGPQDQLGGLSLGEMVNYYFAVSVVTQVVMTSGPVMALCWQAINRGQLTIYLCRPIDYQWYLLATRLGPSLFNLATGLVVLVGGATLLGLPWAAGPGALALMVVSCLLGVVIMFAWWFLLGGLSFWFYRLSALRDIVWVLIAALSGQLIPVSLLPPLARTIGEALPFRCLYDIPVMIYLGKVAPPDQLAALYTQGAWAVGLILAGRLLWARGLRRYEAQGG